MSEHPLPEGLEAATADQPGARAALAAALAAGPSHAYTFVGPPGSGKAAAARAFVAELLAEGAPDPGTARRRALADPSPHPDLAWVRPPGTQHLVEELRERVIAAVPYRPFEGDRRAFVIEDADAMAEESQNALLKTLEEPPAYAHLILITAEPSALLDTVRSRCQEVVFAPLPTETVAERLAAAAPGTPPATIAAAAALAGGDLTRARLLVSPAGARLRDAVETCVRATHSGRLADRPWAGLLKVAAEQGEQEGARVEALAVARAEEIGKGRDADRIRREGAEAGKRAGRRARTAAIDLALALTAAWFADLIALAEGVPGLVANSDRAGALAADAEGIDADAARRGAEAVMDTRRRLDVNVNEELALDALFHRCAALIGDGGP